MRRFMYTLGLLIGPALVLGCKPPPPVAKAPPAPPPPVVMEQVKAQKGVGLEGKSLEGESGVIVTPVKALFLAKQEIAFEINFRHQYQIYRVTGELPKDFDDLTEKVLKPFQIKLPKLPPGHKYIWDAANEELMVERPASIQPGSAPPAK